MKINLNHIERDIRLRALVARIRELEQGLHWSLDELKAVAKHRVAAEGFDWDRIDALHKLAEGSS